MLGCRILRINGEIKERSRKNDWRTRVFIIYSVDEKYGSSPPMEEGEEVNYFLTTELYFEKLGQVSTEKNTQPKS